MNRLIGLGLSRGWRQGILKGDRLWMIVGGLALLARIVQWASRREDEVVFHEELRPGETLTVTNEPRA